MEEIVILLRALISFFDVNTRGNTGQTIIIIIARQARMEKRISSCRPGPRSPSLLANLQAHQTKSAATACSEDCTKRFIANIEVRNQSLVFRLPSPFSLIDVINQVDHLNSDHQIHSHSLQSLSWLLQLLLILFKRGIKILKRQTESKEYLIQIH